MVTQPQTSGSCPVVLGTAQAAKPMPYDPRLLGGGSVIPYIGSWTGEQIGAATVVRRPQGGIGYPDEILTDRDDRDVLWTRATSNIGAGRPLFTALHPLRQRRAMRRLLCQVCATPADRGADGRLLWLVPHHTSVNDLPDDPATIHPPLCVACARISVRMCPGLRPPFLAVWARSRLCGVTGLVFRPVGRFGLAFWEDYPDIVGFADPVIRWTQATQLARDLIDVTAVDLGGL